MTAEALLIDDHAGNTQRELNLWMVLFPGDDSLIETAHFIEEVVADWRAETCEAEDSVRKIFDRYLATEGQVSGVSSTVLMRAPMWFAVEAGISPEKEHEIWKHYVMKEIIYGQDF